MCKRVLICLGVVPAAFRSSCGSRGSINFAFACYGVVAVVLTGIVRVSSLAPSPYTETLPPVFFLS